MTFPWQRISDLAHKATRRTFGRPVTYTHRSAPDAPVTITAIFDAAHQVVTWEDGQPVSATRPMLDVRLADLASAPKKGDGVVIDGVSYEVSDVQPGGHGSSKLMLVEV